MRRIAWIVVFANCLWTATAAVRAQNPQASPQIALPTPQSPVLPIPAGLPRYEINARLDLTARKVAARERVVFTNGSKTATSELVFHVYPRYKVKDQDRAILSKTLELLRLSP